MDNLLSQKQFDKTVADVWRRADGPLRSLCAVDFDKLRAAYAAALTEIATLKSDLVRVCGESMSDCPLSECYCADSIATDLHEDEVRQPLPAPPTDKETTS